MILITIAKEIVKQTNLYTRKVVAWSVWDGIQSVWLQNYCQLLTLLLDLMLSRCTAVASPIALCPQSSRPIVAYVADIIAMGKKYVSIIKHTLYLQSNTKCYFHLYYLYYGTIIISWELNLKSKH